MDGKGLVKKNIIMLKGIITKIISITYITGGKQQLAKHIKERKYSSYRVSTLTNVLKWQ